MLQQLSEEQQRRLPAESRRCWVLYFSPDDIDELYQTLLNNGLAIGELHVTDYGTRAYFTDDPDGCEIWIS